MLELSDIKSSEEELLDYYEQLRVQHVTPAWIGGGISTEPHSKAVPYLWRWRDLRPQAMRAAELVGTQQAERRVLRLTNPELSGTSASNTLVANIQIVMPGEIARAHRHSAAALRFIIEGQGGYTVVNSERVPMFPGDLVLTPNWSWHDHANNTDAPMIWLDGLDTPLVRMLEAGFYEEYHEERQEFGATPNASPWHYPMSEMRSALQRLAAEDIGDGDGIVLEYKNRVTGGPVMPTIACWMQLLRPGEKTPASRRVSCTNYHVVEGTGYSLVDGQRLDWEDKDVFTVPTWTFAEHVNSGNRPAFLFSFSDAPVMKALSLYREETRDHG
jgi:gentisate 1,2-dioxygenase